MDLAKPIALLLLCCGITACGVYLLDIYQSRHKVARILAGLSLVTLSFFGLISVLGAYAMGNYLWWLHHSR